MAYNPSPSPYKKTIIVDGKQTTVKVSTPPSGEIGYCPNVSNGHDIDGWAYKK